MCNVLTMLTVRIRSSFPIKDIKYLSDYNNLENAVNYHGNKLRDLMFVLSNIFFIKMLFTTKIINVFLRSISTINFLSLTLYFFHFKTNLSIFLTSVILE